MARITWAPEVIDGVLAAVRALDGYRAPTDTTDGVTVLDGPEALYYGDDLGSSYVIVGYGGEDTFDPGDQAADSTAGQIAVRAIAPTSPKEENADLEFLAVYRTGDFDVSAARTAVVQIGSDVDTALRAAPRVGVTADSSGAQVLWGQVSAWSLRSYLRGTDLVAELRFTVSYYTRT